MKSRKVIGLGFHKTGTKTLATCLRMLGYNHISCNKVAFLLYQESEIRTLLKIMRYFDSFEDWPWPFVYKEAYQAFPESKFILTTRMDEETWFRSLSNHVKRGAGGTFKYRKYIYGYENPDDNKSLHIQKYNEHNMNVREFFKDKPESLLEVCWERGDGWQQIGRFLDLDTSGLPFPHANKAPENNINPMRITNRIKKAVKVLVRG